MPALSIFFFSHSDSGPESGRYDFVLRTAVLAEDLGFQAVWLPERHFHPFGGLFPNPAVVAAALAARTQRIGLRAGSVVLPLHHVARVAEEWGVVDALSNGRAGVSLASGWNRADFVLGTCGYAERRGHLLATVDMLQELWRGGDVSFPMEDGIETVRTYPVPLQRPIPLWLTATSGSATFAEAGRRGLGLLTAYLQQSRQDMENNARGYREAFAAKSPGGTPHLTLMVHACAAPTRREALAAVQEPLTAYQDQFLDLHDRGHDPDARDAALTERERRELARYAAYKYASDRGLIGGPTEIAERLRYLASIGVDEVACLVDFGLTPAQVTDTLLRLAEIAKN
jgi:natural product biosynthesis luciferase-like monooxygenase protein